MVTRENKNHAYAEIWGTNKEYYGIFRKGLYTHYKVTHHLSTITCNEIGKQTITSFKVLKFSTSKPLSTEFNVFLSSSVDTSRVVLTSSKEDKDYINASFVDVSIQSVSLSQKRCKVVNACKPPLQ